MNRLDSIIISNKLQTSSSIDGTFNINSPVFGTIDGCALENDDCGTIQQYLRSLFRIFLVRIPTDLARESGKLTSIESKLEELSDKFNSVIILDKIKTVDNTENEKLISIETKLDNLFNKFNSVIVSDKIHITGDVESEKLTSIESKTHDWSTHGNSRIITTERTSKQSVIMPVGRYIIWANKDTWWATGNDPVAVWKSETDSKPITAGTYICVKLLVSEKFAAVIKESTGKFVIWAVS